MKHYDLLCRITVVVAKTEKRNSQQRNWKERRCCRRQRPKGIGEREGEWGVGGGANGVKQLREREGQRQRGRGGEGTGVKREKTEESGYKGRREVSTESRWRRRKERGEKSIDFL